MTHMYSPMPGLALPTAPPTLPVPLPTVWRKGKLLIVANNARLNGLCVKCNAPVGEHRMKKTYYWHHPAIFITVLAGLLIYVVLALILRKKCTVHFGVCGKHRQARWRNIAISWLLVLGGVGMFVAAVANDVAELALLGLACFLTGLFYAVLAVPLLTPKRIDERFGRFKGCSNEYLAAYPEWVYD